MKNKIIALLCVVLSIIVSIVYCIAYDISLVMIPFLVFGLLCCISALLGGLDD